MVLVARSVLDYVLLPGLCPFRNYSAVQNIWRNSTRWKILSATCMKKKFTFDPILDRTFTSFVLQDPFTECRHSKVFEILDAEFPTTGRMSVSGRAFWGLECTSWCCLSPAMKTTQGHYLDLNWCGVICALPLSPHTGQNSYFVWVPGLI